MANVKITELIQTTDISDSDLFIVETSNGTRSIPYEKVKELLQNESVLDKVNSMSDDLNNIKNTINGSNLCIDTFQLSSGTTTEKLYTGKGELYVYCRRSCCNIAVDGISVSSFPFINGSTSDYDVSLRIPFHKSISFKYTRPNANDTEAYGVVIYEQL